MMNILFWNVNADFKWAASARIYAGLTTAALVTALQEKEGSRDVHPLCLYNSEVYEQYTTDIPASHSRHEGA